MEDYMKVVIYGLGRVYDEIRGKIADLYDVVALCDKHPIDGAITPDQLIDIEYDKLIIASDKYSEEIYTELVTQYKIDRDSIQFYRECPGLRRSRESFSQSGEDMIVDFIFKAKGIELPSYIDIGANDPMHLSNTAYFYEKGCTGINIEPNPILYKRIKNKRKKDINLNIGLGEKSGFLDFYVMDSDTMSSFSKENVEELCKKYSFSVKEIVPVEVKTINEVCDVYWGGRYPDYISLDVEGMDWQILNSMNFQRAGAYVICVETVEYTDGLDGGKDKDIIEFMTDNGYIVYADTHINTIFVKKSWI